MKNAFALLVLAALSASVIAQTTYRWVDDQGKVHFSDQPPPQKIKKVEERKYGADAADLTLSYTVRKAAADFPVTLYTAADCGEPCDSARQLLSARGVPFSEKLIKTEAEVTEYRKVFGGPDEVPAVTIGPFPRRGFEKGAWTRLLDDAGYPRTPPPPR
jgi:hypothetical protein